MDSPYWSDIDSEAEDEELAIEAKRALAWLQTFRNYRYVEFLAQGGYGWVSRVYDDAKKKSLAIKCTSDTSEMELSWWPRLDHPNILPLLEYITLDTCTVFIMPVMRKDLWMVVNEPQFYEEELSFGLCRIWLKDLASALAYLHGQFLCHLDLKLDNVFLKEDGYACLGDFSLLSDIREVPSGFHFLEIYEPPEYTEWCHSAPPEAIASSSKFGGDKADMWQYGILAIDLLTNLKLTGSHSSRFTLFHHDVWPVLQKILLHDEYCNLLLEETFLNVLFKPEDLQLCHNFITSIVNLEPGNRMSAEDATKHGFINVEWPQLPREFTLPEVVVEHISEPLPLPIEQIEDPSSSTAEQVMATAEEEKEEDDFSAGALDVMKRKMKKMQKEKAFRRESILVESGKKLLEIKKAPSGLQKKVTPWAGKVKSSKRKGQSAEDKKPSDVDDAHETKVKVTTKLIKSPAGKKHPVKVTSIKKTTAVSKLTKKKEDDTKKEKETS